MRELRERRHLEADGIQRAGEAVVPGGIIKIGQELAADGAEHAADAEDRVEGAERVLEHALNAPVISLERGALQLGNVGALEGDAAFAHRGEAQDHAADRGLARAAFADQRDHLAGLHLEVDLVDHPDAFAAEGAGPIDLGNRLKLQHGYPPSSRRPCGRGRSRRRAAPRRISPRRADSGRGNGSRPADRAGMAAVP